LPVVDIVKFVIDPFAFTVTAVMYFASQRKLYTIPPTPAQGAEVEESATRVAAIIFLF
jgi:hypothetical protein